MTLGLRFARSQVRVLRNIAEDLRVTRPEGVDISLFDKAAESTEDGEPLVVRCDNPDEVHQMAALFATLGVKRPAVESLNG